METGQMILSLLRIPIKQDIDISDVGSPAGRLWESALKYVQSCPGCEGIFVAQHVESPRVIEILIPWIDNEAYESFQLSLGFGTAAAIFDPISHHHMCITQSEVGGDGRTTYIWEYRHNDDVTEEFKTNFSIAWNEATKSQMHIVNKQEGWLLPEPEFRRPDNQDGSVCFVGILVIEEHQKFQFDAEGAATINSTPHTIRLNSFRKIDSKQSHNPLPISDIDSGSVPPTSLADLLTFSPIPRFTPEDHRGCEGESDHGWDPRWDSENRRSEQDESTGRTCYARPSGGYQCMDRLTRNNSLANRYRRKLTERAVDIIHFTFNEGEIRKLEKARFEQGLDSDKQSSKPMPADVAVEWCKLRTQLLSYNGCDSMIYGKLEDHPEIIMLLIVWKSAENRDEHLPGLLERDLQMLNSYLQEPPRLDFTPFMEVQLCTGSRFEVVRFFVPKAVHSREIFEQSYYTFTASFSTHNPVSDGGHVGSAGDPWQGCWLESTVVYDGEEAEVFQGLIDWSDDKAEADWYKDFREGMFSYERLGYKVDGLKAVIAGAESFHYELITHRKKDEERFQKKGGSVF